MLTLGVGATAALGEARPPDGRAYELVSSQKKNGNEAGVRINNSSVSASYALASAGGDRVVYGQSGPSGQTSSGTDLRSVANRTPEKGWEASAALPPLYLANGDFLGQAPVAFLPSADLSRFLFVATGPYVEENSKTLADENLGLYRTRGNSSQPEWLSRPTFTKFSEAKPEPGTIEEEGIYPVGGSSPDLSTVYFTYFGTLVPEDNSRRPLVHAAGTGGPWGFYEWKERALHSAGVLPANSPIYPNEADPYGAVPAVTQNSTGSNQRQPFPRFLLNEVSQDGSKAFFVSPMPAQASEAGTPTELYVREQTAGGPKTVLVSRDELNSGTPAPGSGAGEAVTPVRTLWSTAAYVYASPDGSRAFFESRDKLAKNAAGTEEPPSALEGEVTEESKVVKGLSSTANIIAGIGVTGAKIKAGTTVAKVLSPTEIELSNPIEGSGAATVREPLTFPGPWTYEFNTEPGKEKVTYLPGVIGPIAASSQDGKSFIFENPSTKEIELWQGGPARVEVASYSTPSEPEFEAVATKDGKVFVFNTSAVLRHGLQEFNNSAGMEQSYRYDAASQALACVSCAPKGTPPKAVELAPAARLIADEGKRVFFSSPATLTSLDTKGVTNAYEWEAAGTGSCASEEREGGCVYLISLGTSLDPSFYVENDESGENVFFATRDGLVKGDTDESYDVYDARVNGGFPEPPPPVECGGNCRASGTAPSLDSLLTTAIGPSGNLPPGSIVVAPAEESGNKSGAKPLTRQQKLAKALKACKRLPRKRRAACERQARRRYGGHAAGRSRDRRRR